MKDNLHKIDTVYYVMIVTSIPKEQICKPRSTKNEFLKYGMFIYKWKLLMYRNENLIKHNYHEEGPNFVTR